MTLTRTNITIPDDLLRQIDELAGPRGRSQFITETLVERVRQERQRRAFAAAAGAMKGRPGEMTPDEVLTFVNGLRDGEREGGR